MNLQLLERLTDFDKEVRDHSFKTTGKLTDANLPMDKDVYANYIASQRTDVKTYEISHLRDYIHFSY